MVLDLKKMTCLIQFLKSIIIIYYFIYFILKDLLLAFLLHFFLLGRVAKQAVVAEKPFACDQCDYRCTKSNNFRGHTRARSRLPATTATIAAPKTVISVPIS